MENNNDDNSFQAMMEEYLTDEADLQSLKSAMKYLGFDEVYNKLCTEFDIDCQSNDNGIPDDDIFYSDEERNGLKNDFTSSLKE